MPFQRVRKRKRENLTISRFPGSSLKSNPRGPEPFSYKGNVGRDFGRMSMSRLISHGDGTRVPPTRCFFISMIDTSYRHKVFKGPFDKTITDGKRRATSDKIGKRVANPCDEKRDIRARCTKEGKRNGKRGKRKKRGEMRKKITRPNSANAHFARNNLLAVRFIPLR